VAVVIVIVIVVVLVVFAVSAGMGIVNILMAAAFAVPRIVVV
jgi:hypothetical protein